MGFGAAAEIAAERTGELAAKVETLRARLEAGLKQAGAVLFGAGATRVPNTSYFAFKGIDGETLIIELDKLGFGVAAGAACSSANPEPSATLLAMGVASEIARGAVRFSLGAANTAQHVDAFIAAINDVVSRFKNLTAMAV